MREGSLYEKTKVHREESEVRASGSSQELLEFLGNAKADFMAKWGVELHHAGGDRAGILAAQRKLLQVARVFYSVLPLWSSARERWGVNSNGLGRATAPRTGSA